MIELFHGTDAKFRKPLLYKCLSYKDFGKGFYLTEKLAMAKQWGSRKNSVRFNINLYVVSDDYLARAEQDGLRVKQFDADAEWAEFVYNNREIEGYTHDYDIVTGPVANSKIEKHFAKIKRGEATFEEIARNLPYATFDADQICLCTERSFEILKYKERYAYPQQNRVNNRHRNRRHG